MILLKNKELKNKLLLEIIDNTSLKKEDFEHLIDTYTLSENKKEEIALFLNKKNRSNSLVRKIILGFELPVNSLIAFKVKKEDILKVFKEKDFFETEYFLNLVFKEYSFSTDDILILKKNYKKRNILKSDNFYNEEFIIKLVNRNKVDNISYLKTLNFSKIKNTVNDYYFNQLHYDFVFDYNYTEEERKTLLKFISRSKKVKNINFLYSNITRNKYQIDSKLLKDIENKINRPWETPTKNRLNEYTNLYKLEFYFNLFQSGTSFKYLIDSHLINKFIDFHNSNKRKFNNSDVNNLLKIQIYNLIKEKKINYISFLNIINRLNYNLNFLFFRDKENNKGAEYIDFYQTIQLFSQEEQYKIIKYIIKSQKVKENKDFNKWASEFILKYNKFNKKDIINLNTEITINLFESNKIKLKDLFKYNIEVLGSLKNEIFVTSFFKHEKLYLKNLKFSKKTYDKIQYLFYSSACEESISSEAILFYKTKFKNIIKNDSFFKEMNKINHFIYPRSIIKNRKFDLDKELSFFKGKNKKLIIEEIKKIKTVLPDSFLKLIKFIRTFENLDIQRYFILNFKNILVENEENIAYNKNIHDSGITFFIKNKKKIKSIIPEQKIKIYFKKMIINENDFNTFLHRIEDIFEKRNIIENKIKQNILDKYQIKKYKKVIKGDNLNVIHTQLYKFYDDLFAKSVKFNYPNNIIKEFCFIEDKLYFFLPKNSKELRIFGNLMNNCIKGYIESIYENKSLMICIMKDGKPYCNCEINPDNKFIREIKLINNTVLSIEERNYIEEKLKYLRFID